MVSGTFGLTCSKGTSVLGQVRLDAQPEMSNRVSAAELRVVRIADCLIRAGRPNAPGKRRRSTEGAEGTNKGHENAEGMALVGVRLTAQLGRSLDR